MFKQITAVTEMNLRNLPQRSGISLVIIIGIAVTVAVLVSVLAMATGFEKTLSNTGRDDRVIVLRGGSNAELSSTISREAVQTIMDAPGVKRDADGKPIASAEMVAIVNLPLKGSGADANVTFRGASDKLMQLRPEIHIVEGRMFQPAVRELIAGRSAQKQFVGLQVGNTIKIRDTEWTVVGIFESNGDAHESELIGDIETTLSAYRRNLFQSVTVMLDSVDAFNAYKDHITTDPTLSVDVKREPEYYASQSEQLNKLLNFLAFFIGGVMALGAIFGTLNTMYSAVSARQVEIATLRALGFGAFPVIVSVFVESLVLALIGGGIGGVLAWVFFNGNTVNTLGANFTQVVFQLTVTPALLVNGITWACIIGIVGGLFPAVRAARLPIATALRGA